MEQLMEPTLVQVNTVNTCPFICREPYKSHKMQIVCKIHVSTVLSYISAKLEQQTLGDGHMHIKGVETGRYIAMNNKGELFSSVSYEFISTCSEEKRKTLFTGNLFKWTFTS